MKKKLITSALLIILILSLALTAVFATGCEAKESENSDTPQEEAQPDSTIAIISDIHVVAEEQIQDYHSESWYKFNGIGQKMLHISAAILESTIDRLIEEKVDAVLVSGDMAEDGAEIAHKYVASALQRLEDAGIPVYVINGNHDLNRSSPGIYTTAGRLDGGVTTPDMFEDIYYNFGYKDALVRDDVTLSYTADIGDKYRLIVMDDLFYEQYPEMDDDHEDECMTPELLEWCVAQIKQAVADGRTPISMTHVPLLQHLGQLMDDMEETDMCVNDRDTVLPALIEAGLRINFCGHLHATDVTTYTYEGNTLYDIETGCLCNVNMPIRYMITYGDDIKFETRGLDKINPDYLPNYLTEEVKEEIKTDLVAYAEQNFIDDMMEICLRTIGGQGIGETLMDMLGFDTTDSDVKAFADNVYDSIILKFLNMPICAKDAEEGELSLEGICAKYGITLPTVTKTVTEEVEVTNQFKRILGITKETVTYEVDATPYYRNITDLAMAVCKMQFKGDEAVTEDSYEGRALRYAIYSAFYFLDDYDLFGKLHSLDSDFPEVDLSGIVEKLFKEDILDVTEDLFILKAVNVAMPIIGDMLPDSVSFLKSIHYDMTTASEKDAKSLFSLLKAFKDFELFGFKVGDYINFDNGQIDLGKVFHEVLWGYVANGTIVDDNVADNNFVLQGYAK